LPFFWLFSCSCFSPFTGSGFTHFLFAFLFVFSAPNLAQISNRI
jgi:hypothetical protein